jgi:inorganic triphosphatase YgiF
MPTEVEAKYHAEGPEPLVALATMTRLGEAFLGPARTADEVDRYLDTADGRLAAALWACRLRSRDGASRVSLKGPAAAGSGGWLHRRPEVEGPATGSLDPGRWPASAARALVDELRGGAALEERLRLRQRRTERAVLRPDGMERLGTLSLDAVQIGEGTDRERELFVVELELAGAADDEAMRALRELAEALARHPGLEPDPRTKLEHALEWLGP